ncbi:hypothetical protein ROA7450_00988 [Roseovarius albus]|uniref:UPF0102 protein ROA7450_00988 n=1 Tax=Roseovarius albus TaxID=1247867 RepID=A0A1X6YKT0_9RHOB|nr:YraN family protein [Roseovarius albus]SLN24309.1 hypothetical protein ROA7450_00988 [Roseovarius albus]
MPKSQPKPNCATIEARAQRTGATAFLAGFTAEDQVAAVYQRRGATIQKRRWQGQGGEIDLIVQEGDVFVFVEVKKARSFQAAAARLHPRQMRRIYGAASEYLELLPKGELTSSRFDCAVVDVQGHIKVIENAFGHF